MNETSRKIHPFKPRSFWDGIDSSKKRFSRFGYLYVNMWAAFRELLEGESGEGSKPKDILKKILQISRNKSYGQPGSQAEDRFYEMCRTLSVYSWRFQVAKANNVRLTDEDLSEYNLTEDVYLTTLQYLSEFVAWAYNIEIPDSVIEMCSKIEESKGPLELEEELALLNSSKDLSDNPSKRFLLIIIIDNAIYMEGRLADLERGVQRLFTEIQKSPSLVGSAELYVATCGGKVTEVVDFAMIDRQKLRLNSLELTPYGTCKMASAINMSLDKLSQRIDKISNHDIDVEHYCPWMIILSDGKFGEDVTAACKRLKETEIQVFPIGLTDKAKLDQLRKLDENEAGIPESIDGFFSDVFNSMKLSQSTTPGGTRISILHQSAFIKKTK